MMKQRITAVLHHPIHVGRRGAALLLFATIFGTYGSFLHTLPGPSPLGLELLTGIVSLNALSAAWIVCAAIAAVAAFIQVSIVQGLAFGGLMSMPLAWSVSYMWSWVTWLATNGTAGSERGWAGGLVWSLLVGLLFLIAGWPEPPRRAKPQ
jgi:hypothetical protein